jgi:hypothetical protein
MTPHGATIVTLVVLLVAYFILTTATSSNTNESMHQMTKQQIQTFIKSKVKECRKTICGKKKKCKALCEQHAQCKISCPPNENYLECVNKCSPDLEAAMRDRKGIRKGLQDMKILMGTVSKDELIEESQRQEILDMFQRNMQVYKSQLEE